MKEESKYLEEKKLRYINRINEIAKESYNEEQKKIASKIIESAPEINHNAISIINENKSLYIDSKNAGMDYKEHSLIIGENYDALKNLLVTYTDETSGKGLIDIIYIDPPYGTEQSKKDGNRSDYKLDIEAKKFIYRDKYTRDGWLNLMNERLILAKKLLKDNGIIFISIDDNNQAYLKVLSDEVFGEENFITNFVWQKKKGGGQAKSVYKGHEYILCYAKNKYLISGLTMWNQDVTKSKIRKINGVTYFINDDIIRVTHGKYKKGTERRCHYEDLLKIKGSEKKKEVDDKLSKGEYILIKSKTDNNKHYIARLEPLSEKRKIVYNIYSESRTEHGNKELNEEIFNNLVLENPKPTELIKFLVQTNNKDDSIILDFFAGSGTTGQAVMELNEEDGGNRKFILVTNNENNIGINVTRERLFRVINGVGSKGESIKWQYSDGTKSLTNNKVRVFDIEDHELYIDDLEKAKKLANEANLQFKLLNRNYKSKNKFDIYYELSSLKPYKED